MVKPTKKEPLGVDHEKLLVAHGKDLLYLACEYCRFIDANIASTNLKMMVDKGLWLLTSEYSWFIDVNWYWFNMMLSKHDYLTINDHNYLWWCCIFCWISMQLWLPTRPRAAFLLGSLCHAIRFQDGQPLSELEQMRAASQDSRALSKGGWCSSC